MKVILLLFALLNVCLALSIDEERALNDQWALYKKEFVKVYENANEEAKRLAIWKSNVDKVTKHNIEASLGKKTFTMKINKFADLTTTEFKQIYNGFKMPSNLVKDPKRKIFDADINVKPPTAVDWRKNGYVTPIKDQGQCGSCWAFSAVGSLEGQHFKATNKLVSLSEQNLVDCSRNYGNQGCDGGFMDQAFQYAIDLGIDTEKSYPYLAYDHKCQYNVTNVGANCTSYVDIRQQDENALENAAAIIGPIAVAIDAGHDSFQLYNEGIYYEMACSNHAEDLDHGVLVVGYDVDGKGKDATNYWIVKNSWGDDWGDGGYIKMSKNKNNNCGIATQASYPLI